MSGLISIDNLSLRPISDELLALNEVSREYGLTLTAEEARELSETRKTALVENERIEAGVGAVPAILKKFCTSRYVNKDNYTYVLNEVTYLFYYIKTETDDKIGDEALIDELSSETDVNRRAELANRIVQMVIDDNAFGFVGLFNKTTVAVPGVVNIGENSPFDFYGVSADTDMK